MLKFSLFCNIAWRRLGVGYRSFGETYRFHLQGPSSQEEFLGCSTFEGGTDRLYRNVCNQAPTQAA